MTVLIALFSQFWPYIFGAIGGLFGLWRVYAAGKSAERAKQREREAESRDIADQVQNDVGAMPDEEARKELAKWAKR